jgi:hypothetical protein
MPPTLDAPPRPRANALLLAVAALPFLLGNQGAVCGTGIPATVIERIVRDAAAPEVAAAMPYAYRYRIRTDAPIAGRSDVHGRRRTTWRSAAAGASR